MMSECFTSQSVTDVLNDIRDMNIPKRMIPDMLSKIMVISLEKTGTLNEEKTLL